MESTTLNIGTVVSPEIQWFVVGLLLVALELFTGTFVVLFFAVGAFATALLSLTGFVSAPTTQIIAFTILSAGGLLMFKDKLKRGWGGGSAKLTGDLGSHLVMPQDLDVNGTCEVHYQGAAWSAVNESGRPLKKGDRVVIARVDGVKLIIM